MTKLGKFAAAGVVVLCAFGAEAAWQPGLKQGIVNNIGNTQTNYRAYPSTFTTALTYELCNKGTGMGNYQTAVCWGQFKSEAKTYAFTGMFDDTVLLIIDGQLVMDSTPLGNCMQGYGTVTLTAGWHDFEFRCGNASGGVGGKFGGGWALKYGIPAEDGEGKYDRTLTDDGNMTVFRYDDGVLSPSTIPLYCEKGFVSKFADGPTSYADGLEVGSVFSRTTAEIVGDGWKDVPVGYVRREYDAATDSWSQTQVEGATISWTVTENPVAFVWLWERKYDIEMTAGANGTVASANGWRTAGGRLKVTATPAAGYAFLKWQGDVPHGLEFAPTIDEPLNAKFQAEAVFTDKVLYVAEDGDDGNAGTVDAPLATIAAAVAAAGDDTVVLVKDGSYTHVKTVLSKRVVVRSLSGDRTKVTLNGGAPAFELANNDAAIVSLTLSKPGAAIVARAGVAYDLDLVSPTTGGEKGPIALGGASLADVFVLRKSRVLNGKGATANAVFGSAGDVYTKGTSFFIDDVFVGCSGTYHGVFSIQGGSGNLTIDRCVARNCYGSETGFLKWVSSGTVKVSNSLFLGNKAATNGSGCLIKSTGGTMFLEGLTCRGNMCNFAEFGSVRDYVNRSIVWDGGSLNAVRSFNCCGSGVTAGENGNVTADPQFTKSFAYGQAYDADDIAEGLWEFAETSPCSDLETARVTMSAFEAVSADFTGSFRPMSGAVNGLQLADAGCYEKLGPFSGEFRVGLATTSTPKALVGEPIVVSALLLGTSRTLKSATWTIRQTKGGEVTTATVETGSSSVLTLAQPEAGLYDISADFTNSEGETAHAELSTVTFVRGVREVYVAAGNPNAAFPWGTSETAATNLQQAVDLLVFDDETAAKVHILPGDYDLSKSVKGALPDGTQYSMILNGNIQVEAEAGPESTTFRNGGNVFYLNHPKALVAGVTFTKSITLPFEVKAGTVSNCVVHACSGTPHVRGRIVDCEFSGYSANGSGMLRLDGGAVLERCKIENITGTQYGIVMTDNDSADASDRWIRNCTICNNTGAWRTLSLEKGHTFVENCILTNNTPQYAVVLGAGSGNILVNSLVANNGDCPAGAAVYANLGSLWVTNSTIVANAGIGVSNDRTLRLCNSIVWENIGGDVKSATSVDHSCFAEAENWSDAGNLDEDPKFGTKRNPYALAFASPCRDRGLDTPGADGQRDLAGNPRKFGRHVDMGCYECQTGGMLLIVR